MRYHQLIFESQYIEDLKDDIVNLLTMSKSHGIDKIKTYMLVKDLKNLGYDVDEKSILPMLDEIDLVTSSDSSFIEINGDSEESEDTNGDMEIPKLDQKPLNDLETNPTDDTIDRIARKRSTEDL